MSLSEIADLITALVAVAAFGFSIYNFVVARQDKKPRLQVMLSTGFLAYQRYGGVSDLSEDMFLIEVANPGTRSVHLRSVGFLYNKKWLAAFPPGTLRGTCTMPCEIKPGENATFWFPVAEFVSFLKSHEIRRGRVKIKARASSAVGNYYFSKTFTLDLDRLDSKEKERLDNKKRENEAN